MKNLIRIALTLLLAALVIWAQSTNGINIKSLTCPSNLTIGKTGTCTVTLNKNAPKGGYAVTLTANPQILLFTPITVTVPEGKTSTSFQVASK